MNRFLIALFAVFALAGISPAAELSGKAQISPTVILKEWMGENSCSVILLQRRDHAPITHADLDAIVFTRSFTRYHYIRRLNDDHRLRLSNARGDIAPKALPGENAKYESLISDNRLYPHLIPDKNGKALMLIYTAAQESIVWSQDNNGEILLEVRDVFKKNNAEFLLDEPMFQGTK
jgi:hypothetical protein